ncbi:hypothetical protein PAHAL_1G452500 [Panicum hallii]|uniref:ATG8-interacting protein 1 n=2 Tax=Panicum hallii TaxID=206008 RepID=A0A2S3GV64_9POAL|nr:hypothetical protein PAHAL_1G452500 [Panicum hallii]
MGLWDGGGRSVGKKRKDLRTAPHATPLSPSPSPSPSSAACDRRGEEATPLLAENMEPDHSGTDQTSPRGNDWEVVQLTASTYAAAPGPAPRRPEPSEESEAKKYSTKGDDSAAALLMSGHFSVSQTEVESLLIGADSKEPHKELCSQDAVSNEGDEQKYQETCKHKLEDDLPSIPSLDKGKNVTLGDMEFDDGKALQGMSLVGEESVGFSSPIYSSIEAEKDLGRSAMESRNEKKTEESTLHIVNPKTGSSNVVSSDEQNKPDGSGPRDAWWKKQLLSLYKNAKESNNFWPIVAAAAAAAALVGLAYFGHRWHKGKLQLQLGKQPPSGNKEKINDAVRPLNRIKDILVAGNHPSPGIHGHARASGM